MALILWTFIPFIVFCFSKTRLPLYLLPLTAPVCVLAGMLLAETEMKKRSGVMKISGLIMAVFLLGFTWWKHEAETMPSGSKDLRPIADAIRTDTKNNNAPYKILMNESLVGTGLSFYLDGPDFERVKVRKGILWDFQKDHPLEVETFQEPVYLVTKAEPDDSAYLNDFGVKIFANESWEVYRRGK